MPESEPRDDTYAIPPIEPVGRFSLQQAGEHEHFLVERGPLHIQIDLQAKSLRDSLADLHDEDFRQVLFDIADYFPDNLNCWSLSRMVTVPDRHALPVAPERFATKTYRISFGRQTGRPDTRSVRSIELVEQDHGRSMPSVG